MKILVAGGAGYIGSHMTMLLADAGHNVVVLDNLSNGHRDAVRGGHLVRGDLNDRSLIDSVLAAGRFDAVMHFASSILVAESVADPARYYRNNVINTANLLESMNRHRVGILVFSSSAAVYGAPREAVLTEDSATAPVNPYGRSKLMVEDMLADHGHAYGLRYSSFRYFNAAGADPGGQLGERHEPESHLIPLALRAAAGRRRALTVYGCDYGTPDGTCIRDYIHVSDLCRAHLLALMHLAGGGASRTYNLGNGDGYSVRQVIEAVRRVTGRQVPLVEGPRREGDPARLVADATRARRELGWRPDYPALDTIIAHAWAWEGRQGMPAARAAAG